jgi:hypothetical protein
MNDDDHIKLELHSQPGEAQAAFAQRLSVFWTHLLRTQPDEFEQVYAEAIAFGRHGECHTREYLAQVGIAGLLERELRAAGIAFAPIDVTDLYSKYEATPSEWMQIEH